MLISATSNLAPVYWYLVLHFLFRLKCSAQKIKKTIKLKRITQWIFPVQQYWRCEDASRRARKLVCYFFPIGVFKIWPGTVGRRMVHMRCRPFKCTCDRVGFVLENTISTAFSSQCWRNACGARSTFEGQRWSIIPMLGFALVFEYPVD